MLRALLRARSVAYGGEHLIGPTILQAADPGDLLIQTLIGAGHVAVLGVLSLEYAVHVFELDGHAIPGRSRRLAVYGPLPQRCRLLRVNGSLGIWLVLILLLHYGMLVHHDRLGGDHGTHGLLLLAEDRLHLLGIGAHSLGQELLLHLIQLVHLLLRNHHLLHGGNVGWQLLRLPGAGHSR